MKVNTLRGTYDLADTLRSDPQSIVDDLLSNGNRVAVDFEQDVTEAVIKRSDEYIFKAQRELDDLDDLNKSFKS